MRAETSVHTNIHLAGPKLELTQSPDDFLELSSNALFLLLRQIVPSAAQGITSNQLHIDKDFVTVVAPAVYFWYWATVPHLTSNSPETLALRGSDCATIFD